MRSYRVYNIPEGDEQKMEILHSLIAIREDHFTVLFNEENGEEAEELSENDILVMIRDVCTS